MALPTLHKALNAFRRWSAGLPPKGGMAPVSPEVRNDLYMAHMAVYEFAAGLARDVRVLDLGCGTGYGADRLAEEGDAVGIDPDERSLGYARKHFPDIRFVSGTAESLPDDLGLFGLIVAANVFPHLESPKAALDSAVLRLTPDGTLVASVPPILDERMMEEHRASGLHRSNLYLWDWESLLRKRFKEIRLHRLAPPAGLDLSNPAPSRFRAEDFKVEEISPARPGDAGSLAAVFVCRGPRI
jgi:SAM-dependent methyltransferase